MKKISAIAGGLLGLVFVFFSLNYFFGFIKMPPPPEGSPAAAFMGAMYGSGYLTFVKVIELVGGVLVAIPKTRNVGLLFLGPVVVNIVAFQIFLARGGLLEPPVVAVVLLAALLLLSGRKSFAKLLN